MIKVAKMFTCSVAISDIFFNYCKALPVLHSPERDKFINNFLYNFIL